MRYRIIDIATAPLPLADVETYVGQPNHRKGTKDPELQAKQVAEKKQALIESAACDVDLCRITAVGFWDPQYGVSVQLCRDEQEEARELLALASGFDVSDGYHAITFNGHAFDLVILQRRARYLGIRFPRINLDRYRSPHPDLMHELSDRDNRRVRSLEFYRRRLNLGPDKPMSGADEARVFETGDWEGLEASVRHDVNTLKGLSQWLGYLPKDAA